MPTSVVVSQIAPLDGDLNNLHVKGTVGGTAFSTTVRNQRFDPVGLQSTVAGETGLHSIYMARYNAIVAAFVASINGQTVTFADLDNQTQTIIYGATPYAFAGYETIEVTATVNGTSTIAHISQDHLLEKAGAPGSEGFAAWLSRRLISQARRNTSYSLLIATYSI
jgi:hypothetical protein